MKDKFGAMLLMRAKAKSAPESDFGYEEEEEEYEGGFEREGKRIAAADLIDAIRSHDEIQVMEALSTFVKLCKG